MPESDAILAELREIRELLDDKGVAVRPPGRSTMIVVILCLAAIVPGGNAIAARIVSILAGAPTVEVHTDGDSPDE